MIPIRKAEVEDLLKNEHRPCLTLVLSPGVKEQGLPVTAAAYRALLRDAQKQCEKYHLGQIEMEELFAPLKLLENDTFFWKVHQHTLIIYRSNDTLHIEHRLADWTSRAIVDDIFHLRYLLVDAQDTLNFNLLLVAKNKAELYKGTKESLALNAKVSLTQSKKDVTEASDNMRQQFHTATSSTHRGSGSNALYGGAGEDDDEDRQDLLRYLKHLDNEVAAALGGQSDPLVLVGVEDTMTRYRKLSQYPHILEETLRYSDDRIKLHMESLALLTKHRKDAKNEILAKVRFPSATTICSKHAKKAVSTSCSSRWTNLPCAATSTPSKAKWCPTIPAKNWSKDCYAPRSGKARVSIADRRPWLI
jgi:hypothetical protein